MEIGRSESDEQLEERINAQAPNRCCTLIYTVSKKMKNICAICTAWKVSKYGVFSGPYLDTFHAALVSFVQFKKREKHQWRSVSFSKVANISWSIRHL